MLRTPISPFYDANSAQKRRKADVIVSVRVKSHRGRNCSVCLFFCWKHDDFFPSMLLSMSSFLPWWILQQATVFTKFKAAKRCSMAKILMREQCKPPFPVRTRYTHLINLDRQSLWKRDEISENSQGSFGKRLIRHLLMSVSVSGCSLRAERPILDTLLSSLLSWSWTGPPPLRKSAPPVKGHREWARGFDAGTVQLFSMVLFLMLDWMLDCVCKISLFSISVFLFVKWTNLQWKGCYVCWQRVKAKRSELSNWERSDCQTGIKSQSKCVAALSSFWNFCLHENKMTEIGACKVCMTSLLSCDGHSVLCSLREWLLPLELKDKCGARMNNKSVPSPEKYRIQTSVATAAGALSFVCQQRWRFHDNAHSGF